MTELQMSAAEMREAGYRTVDMLVRQLTDETAPPLRRATAEQMRDLLGGPAPEEPTPLAEVLDDLERDVLPYRARGDHPGFFAFISYCGTWPGALGDFIASATNIYASTWLESAGPSQVELEVLDWFKGWLGYPSTASGILVSGGSAANMTALACARESLVGPMSDDLVAVRPRPGALLDRAGGPGSRLPPLAGARTPCRREAFASIPTRSAVRSNRPGRRPAAAVRLGQWRRHEHGRGRSTAGDRRDLPIGRCLAPRRCGLRRLRRPDRARTRGPRRDRAGGFGHDRPAQVALSAVRVRVPDGPRRSAAPPLLRDRTRLSPRRGAATWARSISRISGCSCRARATRSKVWTSIRTFGVAAFRTAIDRSIDQANLAERLITESDTLEVVSPAQLGVICFRRRFDDAADEYESDAMHEELIAALERSGIGFISSTRLRGRFAMRMCIMNFTTRDEDIAATIEFLANAPVAPRPAAVAVPLDRHASVERGWLDTPRRYTGRPDLCPAALCRARRGGGSPGALRRERADIRAGRAAHRAVGGLALSSTSCWRARQQSPSTERPDRPAPRATRLERSPPSSGAPASGMPARRR